MRHLLIGVFACGFAAVATAQGTTAPPVTLPRTQLRNITSTQVGQEFQLRVSLPEEYATTDRRFPVVYLLDGDLLFGTAAEAAQYLKWGQRVPPLIIVGIGYGSIHSPENGGTNMRARDMSVFPAQPGYVDAGGARFLSFIREQLIPYVDREFRTDTSDRVLFGFSRGADFTVYTLFSAPQLFRRYIAVDNYYPDYARLADAYAARGHDLPKSIFVSSRFPRSGMRDFAELLRTRFPSAQVHYADAVPRHFAAGPDGFVTGLSAVYNRTSIYETLLPMVLDHRIDEVIAEYRRLKPDTRTYNVGETELVELGNALVTMQRPADAVKVYELNLESYPTSAATHTRLGTAYERLGNKTQALQSFRRAVELNPADRFATDAVKRLSSP